MQNVLDQRVVGCANELEEGEGPDQRVIEASHKPECALRADMSCDVRRDTGKHRVGCPAPPSRSAAALASC